MARRSHVQGARRGPGELKARMPFSSRLRHASARRRPRAQYRHHPRGRQGLLIGTGGSAGAGTSVALTGVSLRSFLPGVPGIPAGNSWRARITHPAQLRLCTTRMVNGSVAGYESSCVRPHWSVAEFDLVMGCRRVARSPCDSVLPPYDTCRVARRGVPHGARWRRCRTRRLHHRRGAVPHGAGGRGVVQLLDPRCPACCSLTTARSGVPYLRDGAYCRSRARLLVPSGGGSLRSRFERRP